MKADQNGKLEWLGENIIQFIFVYLCFNMAYSIILWNSLERNLISQPNNVLWGNCVHEIVFIFGQTNALKGLKTNLEHDHLAVICL